jgi:hypothetical protein
MDGEPSDEIISGAHFTGNDGRYIEDINAKLEVVTAAAVSITMLRDAHHAVW